MNDIVEDIEIKPNKSKKVLKWVVSISVTLIGIAFALGQFKASFFNRMDRFEETLNKNTATIEQFDGKLNDVHARIDKVYDDGIDALNDFQKYNNKQLELVIDYGQENKEMLKKMLEINELERKQKIELQAEQAKNENPIIKSTNPPMEEPVIGVRRQSDVVFTPVFDDPYVSHVQMIEVESDDTINYLTAATEEYIKNLDKKKYIVGVMTENSDYPGRYDIAYRNR